MRGKDEREGREEDISARHVCLRGMRGEKGGAREGAGTTFLGAYLCKRSSGGRRERWRAVGWGRKAVTMARATVSCSRSTACVERSAVLLHGGCGGSCSAR